MEAYSRAHFILKKVADLNKVSVAELATEMDVSTETVRRDLTDLDKKGELIKVRGGAVKKHVEDISLSFNSRAMDNLDDKRVLVKEVLPHFFAGAIIGLDASSTSWLVAKSMPNIPCSVITNSLNNVEALSGKENINIIGLGGIYSDKHRAFYGISTTDKLQEMTLDLCVISCAGIDKISGVWDSSENNYLIKKSFIQVSDKVILIADKSKHKKKSLLKVCDLAEIDVLVTNIE